MSKFLGNPIVQMIGLCLAIIAVSCGVYWVVTPGCDAASEGEIGLIGQKLKTCRDGKWVPLHSERELRQK